MAVIIEPDKGKAAEIGRQLLALADNPNDVQWASWPVAGFRVPEELALRLRGVRSLPVTEQSAGEETPVIATAVTQPAQDVGHRPRRPGRPRRTVTEQAPVLNTDDPETEE